MIQFRHPLPGAGLAERLPLKNALVTAALLLLCSNSAAWATADSSRTFTLQNLHFERFQANGFGTTSPVHDVLYDSRGRLWIGTETGLYLYDGHGVTEFRHDPADLESIPHSFTVSIVEDLSANVWLGTWGGGIARFNERKRNFERVRAEFPSEDNPLYQFDGKLWKLAARRNGRLLLGTFGSGLLELDPQSRMLQALYQPEVEDPRQRRTNALLVDSTGNTWFAQYGRQLQRIPVDTDRLLGVETPAGGVIRDLVEFPDGQVAAIMEFTVALYRPSGELLRLFDFADSSGRNVDDRLMSGTVYDSDFLLLGTAGNGLFVLDRLSGNVFRKPAGKQPGTVEAGIQWDAETSARGDLIVAGTSGIWIAPASSRQFWGLHGDRADPFLSRTRALHYDFERKILLANDGNKLIEFALDLAEPLRLTKISARTVTELPTTEVFDAFLTPDGTYWVSTSKSIYAGKSGTFTKIADVSASQFRWDEKKQRVVLGLETDAAAFGVIDDTSSTNPSVRQFKAPPGYTDSRAPTVSFAIGTHDDVLVGTFVGLARFDANSGEALPVFAENAYIDPAWNDPFVSSFMPLDSSRVVITTSQGPWLTHLDSHGRISQLKQLISAHPAGQTAMAAAFSAGDDIGFLSSQGLLKVSLPGATVQELLIDDGFPTTRPTMGAIEQTVEGVVVSSGRFGPLIFKPSELSWPDEVAPIQLTEITSFRDNDTVRWIAGESQPFTHQDRVIQVKFGLLDPLSHGNNRYELRLLGFQDEWINVGRLSEFNFTNLDPGNYQLQIRGINGRKANTAFFSTDMTVLPPWWRTWWAYTFYALIILGSLFWYWLLLQRKIQRERETSTKLREADRIKSHFLSELEEKVEEATRDLRHAVEALEIKNVELDAAQSRAVDASRLKSEFLANMSHELRTPMNAILGFTQLLEKTPLDGDQRDYVHTVDKSARSLLGIINDVLDVSKIEAGKLIIDSVGFDLRECLSDTLEALAPVAYDKNLELIWQVDSDVPEGLRGDPVRLRQMVTNLVGNGLKFTDAGHVRVYIKRQLDARGLPRLHIMVADTGRGITRDDQQKLFNAFERGSISLSANYTGTGLGLVITKKLCEAMGGTIALESSPGEGTSISLDLPLIADRNPENRYGHGKPLRDRSLLLIDTHPQSREALRTRFEHWGADVTALAAYTSAGDADLIVIGLEPNELADSDRPRRLCSQLPAGVPKICLASRIDRDVLREIDEACGAPCISKLAGPESQLRHLLQALGDQWRDESGDATASETRLAGLHVLVADDNRINRYFLKKMLELHGADVIEADSGQAVLRYLAECAQAQFDLAMLDIHMPDMDGLELARRIRAAGNTALPLLAVSANVQPEAYEAALAAGINDYLLKPVDEKKLVESVLEWTGRETVATQ